MNVWMSWCRKRTECRYCNQLIDTATPVVVCRSWANGKKHELRYHPQCWLDNGIDYLRQNPYTAMPRGRKKLTMSEDDTKTRRTLLVRHAAVVQRISRVKAKYPDRLLPIARLEKRMKELAKEIEPFGGVPKKWLVE